MTKFDQEEVRTYAAYWTTMEASSRQLILRFRFPMGFGMLRAAEWAETEMRQSLRWWNADSAAQTAAAPLTAARLQTMMPFDMGRRHQLYCTRMMNLTVGAGSIQIEMVLQMRRDAAYMSSWIEQAIVGMMSWMRANAYTTQMP